MHTILKSIVFILLIPENIFLYIVQISEVTQTILIILSKWTVAAGFWTLLTRKCQEVSVVSIDKQLGLKKLQTLSCTNLNPTSFIQKRPLKRVSSGCFGRLSSGDNLTLLLRFLGWIFVAKFKYLSK